MTTIAFAHDALTEHASGIRRSAARDATTRLRLTARGRRVLAGLLAAPVVAALAVALIGGGGAVASDEQGAPAGSFETVTVMAGESLWSIAQEIAPGADPRDVVSEIIRLNALDSATVGAGASIAIPMQYATPGR